MKSLYLFGLLFATSLLHQGCVAWRYTTTPVVAGRVLDGDTRKPVVGAEVGIRTHEHASTRTKDDGSFLLPSDHAWGPAFGIPFEFTPCGGMLFVSAPGYRTFEQDLGQRVYHPVQISDVLLAKKAPIQSPEPTRWTQR